MAEAPESVLRARRDPPVLAPRAPVVGEEEGQASALAVDRVPQELVPQEWAQAQGLELVPELVPAQAQVPERVREPAQEQERVREPAPAGGGPRALAPPSRSGAAPGGPPPVHHLSHPATLVTRARGRTPGPA